MNSVELAQNHGDDAWRKEAACRDSDPNLFFPVGTTGPAIEQIENAKEVCRTCNVQVACFEFALATHQDSGIWGGTSEEERRKIAKERAERRPRASAQIGETAIQLS